MSRLNEWPAFNVIVRAHPTLAAMAGRGTDPAGLLPPARIAPASPWHAGWFAALGKFLLGLESPVGILADPQGGARERETVARLLDEEIAKVAESKPSQRGDFLARYARIIQHYDLVKPTADLPKSSGMEPPMNLGLKPPPKTIPISKTAAKRNPLPALGSDSPNAPLTSGGATRKQGKEESHIGFAELLFKNAGNEPTPPDAPDWARAAANAPPTLPSHLIPRDDVPMWLKASVFIGGSMVLGAILAHLSGDALWLKKRAASGDALRSRATAVAPALSVPAPAPAPPRAPAPEKSVPKAIPEVEPAVVNAQPETDIPSGRGMSLSLPNGAGGLREQLSAEPSPPAQR